jgi:membrane fusion protein, copper/silver efflux system
MSKTKTQANKKTLGLSLFLLSIFACTSQTGTAKMPDSAPSTEHAGHGGLPGYASFSIDEGRIQALGIQTASLQKKALTKLIRTVAKVTLDETRTEHVHVKFDGFIEDVYANYEGQSVKKGDKLFRIYSQDLLSAQEEYLVSLASLKKIPDSPFAEPSRNASTSIITAAKRRLELYDLPGGVISNLEKTGKAQKYIMVTSPRDGVILEKNAIAGHAVEPMTILYIIADLSKVWVAADVYEKDISLVKQGQEASLTLEALPGKSFTGVTTFLSPTIDETTRTVKARFEFDNKDGLLKPGMYATVELHLDLGEGLAIPNDAIINTGERKIVFVSHPGGHFEPREITLGISLGDSYQVLSGLEAGEQIAISGQFLLDSESRLRAAGSSAHNH